MANLALKVIFCTLLVISSGYYKNYNLEVFKWKSVKYENLPKPEDYWVGPYEYYIPENHDIAGMSYHPVSGLMFVAMGRVRPGYPATVAAFCVSDYNTGSSPKFWAFPDFKTNALRASDFDSNSEDQYIYYDWNYSYQGRYQYIYHKPKPKAKKLRIINVNQVNVDEKCNRLFFIDTGNLNYYGNTSFVIQKPALLVYDIPANGCETREFKLIRREEIPDRVAKSPYGFLHMTLDYQSENCDDLFIYTTNVFNNYVLVYDYERSEFWSFTDHPTFLPISQESNLIFDNKFTYSLNTIGLLSFALGYANKYGDRTAYYIGAASTAQFAVSTRILKDRKKSPRNYNPDDFKIMGYRGCDSQAGKMVVDYTYGVIFYAELQTNRVRCWNMNKPLNPDNIGVVFESENLDYPLQMFTDSKGYLWFNSCQIPITFLSDTPLNLNKINYRFFRIKISEVIQGTVCEDF